MTSAEDRFWAKVDQRGACWRWTGATTRFGYGTFRRGSAHRGGTTVLAHRFAWELANEAVPPRDRLVLHSCDNPWCVNPAHLRLGDHFDNAQDAKDRGRAWQYHPRAMCPHGHALTDANVYRARGTGWRQCRTCRALRKQAARAKQRLTLTPLSPSTP